MTCTHCKRSCGLPSCRCTYSVLSAMYFPLCLRFLCARRISRIIIIRAKAATYQNRPQPEEYNTRFRFSYRSVAVFRPSPREIDRPIRRRRREFRQISKLLPFTSRLLNKQVGTRVTKRSAASNGQLIVYVHVAFM